MSNVPKILIVEDQEELHRLLHRVFGDAEVRSAYNGAEGLEIARSWRPDLVISDHCMPGMTGVAMLSILREEMPSVMRVLVSAVEDRNLLIDAVNTAAIHQFLEKPFQLQKMRLVVDSLLREQQLRIEKDSMAEELKRANRSLREQQALLEYLVEQRTFDLSSAKEELERTNSSLSQSNSALEQANRKLQESLMRDSLTLLFTRQYMSEQMQTEIARAQRYARPLALFFVDIDNFKAINDTYGHQVGDKVLAQFGQFFQSPDWQARATDIAGRYGGEEFLILLPETSQKGAIRKGERLRRQIRGFNWDDIQPGLGLVTASFGASFYPDDGSSPAELLATADQRLYMAKRCGKDRLVVGGTGRVPRATPNIVLGSRLGTP